MERETGDVMNPWQTFEATYQIDNRIATVVDPPSTPRSSAVSFSGDTIDLDYDALNRMIEKAPDGMPVVTIEYAQGAQVIVFEDAGATIFWIAH